MYLDQPASHNEPTGTVVDGQDNVQGHESEGRLHPTALAGNEESSTIPTGIENVQTVAPTPSTFGDCFGEAMENKDKGLATATHEVCCIFCYIHRWRL